MCDLNPPLNVPSSAFDKMPLTIDSSDPLFNVGAKELAAAMQTPSEHSWVANWLFTNAAQPFHSTPLTLPPELFENSLAMHLHHDISSPDICPTDVGYVSTTSSFSGSHQSQNLPKFVHTKDLDLLLVPVAKISQITVGYAFIRGMEHTPMQSMYSELVHGASGKNTAPPQTVPNVSTARFCFHHTRMDYTMVVTGIGGHLMGIVSMRWVSPTARERSFIIVPNASYGPRCLPSRVLSLQSQTDYLVPVPEHEIAPISFSSTPSNAHNLANTDTIVPNNLGNPLPKFTSETPASMGVLTNGSTVNSERNAALSNGNGGNEDWSVKRNSNHQMLDDAVALGAMGTLVSPSASGEITLDAAQDYLLNYIDTEIYDQVLKDPTSLPIASDVQNIRPLPPDATLDEILSVASSLATSSGSASGSGSRSTSSGSSGNVSSLSFSMALPLFDMQSEGFAMDVDDDLHQSEVFPGLLDTPEVERVGHSPLTGGITTSTEADVDGLWLLSSEDGTTPDGVGVPRSPGKNDTSSGAFNLRELREALGSIESSFKGVYFGPRVRKDIMHPQTGELLSRCTGEVSAKLFRPDDVTVSMLRRIAAQSYYGNFLSVSSDTGLVAAATTRLFSQSSGPTYVHQQNQQQEHQLQQGLHQPNQQHQTKASFPSSYVVPYLPITSHPTLFASSFISGAAMGTTSQQAPSPAQPPLQLLPQPRLSNNTTTLSGSTGPSPSSSRRKSTPRKAPSPSPAPSLSSPLTISDKVNGNNALPSNAETATSVPTSVPASGDPSAQKPSQALASPAVGNKTGLNVHAARQTIPFKRQAAAPLAPRPVALVPIGPMPPVGTTSSVAASSGVSNSSVVQPIPPSVGPSVGTVDNTRESKLEAKRIRNRLSAAKSNQKRREHLEAQKKELSQLKARVEQLRSREALIVRENESLRKQIAADNLQTMSR